MIINSKNKHEFEKLDLHDAELLDINCDYRNQTVLISTMLNIPNQKSSMLNLMFKDISFFSISCQQSWGSGFYFFEASIDDSLENNVNLESDCSKIKFLIILNSGDQIKIESSCMKVYC